MIVKQGQDLLSIADTIHTPQFIRGSIVIEQVGMRLEPVEIHTELARGQLLWGDCVIYHNNFIYTTGLWSMGDDVLHLGDYSERSYFGSAPDVTLKPGDRLTFQAFLREMIFFT